MRLPWQLAALALALASAWWAHRATAGSHGRSTPARRLDRLAATGALLLVIVWAGGAFALRLVWPR